MTTLTQLLQSESPHGVYWLTGTTTFEAIKHLAKHHGLAPFHLDGTAHNTKEQFLRQAAVALHFPDYAGMNWDAFEECITDMSWAEGDGYLIFFEHVDDFAEHAPQHFDTLLEILGDAAKYWAEEQTSFVVVLTGKHPPKGLKKIAL